MDLRYLAHYELGTCGTSPAGLVDFKTCKLPGNQTSNSQGQLVFAA